MAENASLEWPRVLRNAAIPATVSRAAQVALRASTTQTAACDLEGQRATCARVQDELGESQRQRHGVTMLDSEIAGIPVRVFLPQGSGADDLGPTLLNLHGGGFDKDAGSVTENVPLAALTGFRIVAVRYRLAPEHPFPAAVEDGEKVYRGLLERLPASSMAIYGTSAGAILAAQLVVRLRAAGTPQPAALGFFTGTADLSKAGDTEHFYRPAQDASRGGKLFASYVGSNDPTDPVVSPLFSDLTGFPPTLCLAGTRDFLLSQTTIFHRALRKAGVDADLVVYEAMLHAHWIYLDIPESDEAFADMAAFFRERVA